MVMSNASNFLCAYIRPRYQISVHSNSRLLIDISLDTCKKYIFVRNLEVSNLIQSLVKKICNSLKEEV